MLNCTDVIICIIAQKMLPYNFIICFQSIIQMSDCENNEIEKLRSSFIMVLKKNYLSVNDANF